LQPELPNNLLPPTGSSVVLLGFIRSGIANSSAMGFNHACTGSNLRMGGAELALVLSCMSTRVVVLIQDGMFPETCKQEERRIQRCAQAKNLAETQQKACRYG
jgi:hypothetical protein